MGRRIDGTLLGGCGIVLVVLVVNAFLSYRNTLLLHEDAGWVIHTHEVLDTLGDLVSNIRQADTDRRSFIISGDERFVQSSERSLESARQRAKSVQAQTADNPNQQARIPELLRRIDMTEKELAATMQARRTQGIAAAEKLLRTGASGEVLSRLGEHVADMESEERALLAKRRETNDTAYRIALTTGLIAGLGSIAVMALVTGLLVRQLRSAGVIHEQRELLHATLASIGDAMIATDDKGRVRFMNAVAEQLTGWSQPEAVGQPLEHVFHIVNEETRKTVENPALRALRHGHTVGLANHTLLIARDGSERPIDDSAAPVRSTTGSVSGAVLIFRDVSERRAADLALRDEARRKDEFLATLAHELRNPLAPLCNAIEFLRLSGNQAAALGQVRDMMERQLKHLVRLVDDLLDMSRIQTGKIELRRERGDLALVVRNAVETARPLIDAAQHTLDVKLPAGGLFVEGDLTRLAQILSNLLSNAARYTPPGGRIDLDVHAEAGQAVIAVQDNGIGIDSAMLPRVFEMFTQVDSSLQKAQGGLGIGLTLVQKLVQMHGGTVEAHSAGAGQGSRFVVRLPLSEVAAAEPTVNGEATTPRPRRILVVDDSADAADSLAMMLRIKGHDVRVAYNGPSAIEAARVFRPDVVLLDIGMPGMNGHEVAAKLRTLPECAGVILIALTGWGQEEDRRRTHASGFDFHLVKPADTEELFTILTSERAPR